MEDLLVVAVGDASQQLIGKALDDKGVESLLLAEAAHVLLEIEVQVLEDEDEFAVGVDDFSQ